MRTVALFVLFVLTGSAVATAQQPGGDIENWSTPNWSAPSDWAPRNPEECDIARNIALDYGLKSPTTGPCELVSQRAQAEAEARNRAAAPKTPVISKVQAQPKQPVQKQALSQGTAVVGFLAILAGMGMAIPRGETWHVDGYATCVDLDGRNIYSGGCTVDPTMRKIGLYTMAAGAGLVAIGAIQVEVKPTVNKDVKAMAVSVSWGAK